MSEQIEDSSVIREQWIEAFDMRLNDEDEWEWDHILLWGDEWRDKYLALLRKWNAAVGDFNNRVAPRNVGRPLAASDAQVTEVRKLHKRGMSLRGIADETSLSLATVRTIVGQKNGTDRTTPETP